MADPQPFWEALRFIEDFVALKRPANTSVAKKNGTGLRVHVSAGACETCQRVAKILSMSCLQTCVVPICRGSCSDGRHLACNLRKTL